MADLPVISPDLNLWNADWPKRTQDVGIPEEGTPEFKAYLKATGLTLAEWKKLPVAKGQRNSTGGG